MTYTGDSNMINNIHNHFYMLILDSIMLIRGSYLPLETSGLLAVDICEIQQKFVGFGDNLADLRV